MRSRVNWKVPVLVIVIIGAFYLYNSKLGGVSGPVEVAADSVIFRRGCANPDAACLELSFVFPSVQSSIPSRLTRSMMSDYLLMVEDSGSVSSMNEFKARLVDHTLRFDSSYTDFSSNFSDASYISWYVAIDYEVIRNDERILTLRYDYSDYMGGAHGMYSFHYQNIDLKDAKILGLSDVFESIDGLYSVADSAFSAKYLAGDGADEPMFGFPNDKFVLPREFGFGAKGLILHYNVYEIACYAQGDIVLEIPYSELEAYLKSDWKFLVRLGQ